MPAVSALPASTRRSDAGSTESSRPSAGLAILLAVLGLGAMATALLGPLALGWIDYHVSSGAADQLRGGDVAGLVLVGPVALAAAWRVATGRPGTDALALAPASYGLYMYTELAIIASSLQHLVDPLGGADWPLPATFSRRQTGPTRAVRSVGRGGGWPVAGPAAAAGRSQGGSAEGARGARQRGLGGAGDRRWHHHDGAGGGVHDPMGQQR